MSFKQNAKINRRRTARVNVTIPLFNAQGKPITDAIYGGSIIKVAFTVRNTWMQASKEAGVRFDIAAVQGLKIQKTDRSASDFGFGVEDDGMAPAAGDYDETAAGPGAGDDVDF